MDDLRTYVSLVSLALALWQYSRNRGIKKLISLEAVELHKNIAFALGAAQSAKESLKTGASAIAEIGRSEGLMQALLFESAKLFCNLKNTTIDDVDDLITSRQLSNDYRDMYYSFSNKKRGTFRNALKTIRRVF